jgi:hypothetical protein
VQILASLDRHLLPVAIELDLCEARDAGLSFESTLSLTRGATHAFRLGAPGGETVTVRARVIRCLRTTAAGEPRFVTDVEFAPVRAAAAAPTRPYFVRSLERVLTDSRRDGAPATGNGPTGD